MYQSFLTYAQAILQAINNSININILLLPFWIYKNSIAVNSLIIYTVGFLLMLFFNFYEKINSLIENNKHISYFYFLSDFFYYIALLGIINNNIFYIHSIINFYNKINIFYTALSIIIILFLFILIKNNALHINQLFISIKLIIGLLIIYLLSLMPQTNTDIPAVWSLKNIFSSIPFIFFSFLENQQLSDNNEKNEPKKLEEITKINLIRKKNYYLISSTIYLLLSNQIITILKKKNFILNKTVSEIFLKQTQNNSTHFLNIFLLIFCFLNIYKMTLGCQKAITKTIQLTKKEYTIPELITLFFVLCSILIINKIVGCQEGYVLITVFFSTLSFICSFINGFHFILLPINKKTIFTLLSLIIINIITVNKLIDFIQIS